MRRIESPADAGSDHPLLEPAEVVVVEAEIAPDRRASGQIEDLGCRNPSARHVEQSRDDPEQGVDLPDRPVGEPDAQVGVVRLLFIGLVAGLVPGLVPGLVDAGMRVERCVDQGGVRLDVGAHDENVAWLEIRVVLEQVQDRVAQDLDLAGTPVARVDLDAAVVGREQRTGISTTR